MQRVMNFRSTWVRIVMLVMVAALIWCIYVVQHIWKIAHTTAPQKADVAIVLGAAVWGEVPSPGLRERLEKAVWLYNNHYIPRIIVSGGLGEGKKIAEAVAMKQYLLKQGIPEGDILEEAQSHDTYQNLVNSQKVMKENNLQTALIVSHEYHLARAMNIAESIQMTAYPVATESFVLFMPYHYAREVLAYSKWMLQKSAITIAKHTSLA